MKSFSSLLLLAMPLMASAFAPAAFGAARSTAVFGINPEKAHNQADSADAFRVVYMECDPEECVMVEGEKDANGQWHDNQHVQGEVISQEVLMMECDDTE